MTLSHKDWVDNEYQQWVKALQESTVDNFGSHPMVRRMLGSIEFTFEIKEEDNVSQQSWHNIKQISNIGRKSVPNYQEGKDYKPLGIIVRAAYYAIKVLQQNPTSICEIGGGVGQFYAVLRALGYKGKYYIYDLKEVREFQRKYLDRVTEVTGLNTEIDYQGDFDFCVSFYAFGEFDDDTKKYYLDNVIKKVPHGLIIFNPHSGASDDIGFDCKIEPEYPLTHPNNKMLTW